MSPVGKPPLPATPYSSLTTFRVRSSRPAPEAITYTEFLSATAPSWFRLRRIFTRS